MVFDLGNVIIDLHYERSVNALRKISGISADDLSEMLVTSPVLKDFEVGKISEQEFRERFCRMIGVNLDEKTFDSIWNALLGVISHERIQAVRQVAGLYQTAILSNTNSIHVRHFDAHLQEAHKIPNLHQLVDRVYFSHEVGMRKPNADIYERMLEDLRMSSDQVLFIDDRLDNIEAAAALGIQVFHNRRVDDWVSALIG